MQGFFSARPLEVTSIVEVQPVTVAPQKSRRVAD